MESARPGRARHRPALIALVVIAATACLALAWWQWSRYESAAGTAQNLGYALQWPAFAAAVIYAYRRFVVLENNADEVDKLSPRSKGAVEIPEGILPERQSFPSAESLLAPTDPAADAGLREYNRYLAELHQAEAGSRGVDDSDTTAR
ncbi:transcriptional regulator [Gordonia pseudamarae]|jgi:DNA-binding transcriptional regulator of glucitol operon|uniref:Transcriptional regulator n=1 Tax=Gordonia pseudamarae TaxID=2831662 RepID=A0ABX6IIC4_9ACTN|nr:MULTISPECIES: transcriptional regulator [Gordonia]MBD0024122.1 transcriptional regulator [Gordonia sp. (in: high G+C Gram-positive bacteria)]QHN25955.1 transcriptional regulator [Gordonia pseudamarae]QHN34886.1 transcriptional regulator [Gordonia pseudamarae]